MLERQQEAGATLILENLKVSTANESGDGSTEILHGIDLAIRPGEVHAVMGPNGSGKSTLANALMGHPGYTVDSGKIIFKGEDITDWPTDIRSKAGIFLAHQHPEAVDGVPVIQFLRQALSARKQIDLSTLELRLSIMEWMQRLDMDPSFADRYLNNGFSGGEKKRNEILQMAILEPDFAVLDETDSGLDIDALNVVSKGIQEVRRSRPQMASVVITHYQRLLDQVAPDVVHVLIDGNLVATGGMEIVESVEAEGFDQWR